MPGSRIVASWTPGGDLNSDVKIELYKGDTVVSLLAMSTPNDGGKGKTLPDTLVADSDYRIKITSVADTSVYDFSDGYFSITGG